MKKKTKKIKLSKWASCESQKDMSGVGDYTTLFYKLELSMPLKDSKVFGAGPIRDALERCNAMLNITLDFVILDKEGKYEVLWIGPFSPDGPGVFIEGLSYNLFFIADCAQDETVFWLDNWTEKEIQEQVSTTMIDDALFLYREIGEKSGDSEITDASAMELIREMFSFTLGWDNQKYEK